MKTVVPAKRNICLNWYNKQPISWEVISLFTTSWKTIVQIEKNSLFAVSKWLEVRNLKWRAIYRISFYFLVLVAQQLLYILFSQQVSLTLWVTIFVFAINSNILEPNKEDVVIETLPSLKLQKIGDKYYYFGTIFKVCTKNSFTLFFLLVTKKDNRVRSRDSINETIGALRKCLQ